VSEQETRKNFSTRRKKLAEAGRSDSSRSRKKKMQKSGGFFRRKF
jgi:hypothetical protein